MKTLILSFLHCVLLVLGQVFVQAAALKQTDLTDAPVEPAEQDATSRGSCSSGWSEFNGRCLRYFSVPVTWATAQKNCVSLQANLASVHNIDEFDEIQRLLMAATNEYKAIWIGGSDAEEVGTWLWSDGSPFHFSHWCPGEPNNGGSRGDQHCLEMNDRGSTCWDDQQCYEVRPFVCAKRINSCAQ